MRELFLKYFQRTIFLLHRHVFHFFLDKLKKKSMKGYVAKASPHAYAGGFMRQTFSSPLAYIVDFII